MTPYGPTLTPSLYTSNISNPSSSSYKPKHKLEFDSIVSKPLPHAKMERNIITILPEGILILLEHIVFKIAEKDESLKELSMLSCVCTRDLGGGGL